MKNVIRNYGNFSNCPEWNTTMTKKEVEYLFHNFSGLPICNGIARRVKTEMITPDCYKVYTEAI